MDILLHIFRYKFKSFLKSTFDLKAVTVVRGLGSIVVFTGFSIGAYFLANASTRFVIEQPRAGLFLFHQFLSMMLFIFFIAVNLGNIIVSYATLYRSAEVGYLLTKPVDYTSIFVLKFLDNFLYSSTTLFLIAFMVICGYGSYFHFPWYYYPAVMAFVLIPFMFLSASIAVLILMAIMKLAGKIGFRKVMGILFLLYFMFIFVFFQYTNPVILVEKVNSASGIVDDAIWRVEPGFLKYLPNHWVALFFYYVAKGATWTGIGYAGLLLCVTSATSILCLIVAKKFYYRSWLVSLQVQAASSVPYSSDTRRWFDFRSNSMLPPQVEALLKREFFQFFREPSQWIHFLVMVFLALIYVFAVSKLNLRLRVTDIQLLTYLVLFAFGAFLTGSLALRFVFPMISLEGKAFWLLLSSPFDERRLYFIKFLIGFVVVLTLALLVAVATNIPFLQFSARRPLLMYAGLFNAFWISLTVVAVNLGLGGFFANYAEKNPIRLASSQGATLTFLATLLYLIMVVVILMLPLTFYFQSLFLFREFDPRVIIVPGTIVAMLSTALTGFSFVFGLNSLRRDFS